MPKKPKEIVNAQALALEDFWWDKGHELNQASLVVKQWQERGPFSESLDVGEPIAGLVDPSGEYYGWSRLLIAEMLYAFAVECWLKGLVAWSFKRGSDPIRKEISKRISDRIPADIESLEDIFDRVSIVSAEDDIQTLQSEYEEKRKQEDETRTVAITEHDTHRLLPLAEAAKISLTPDLEHFLNVLSIVNVLGRYPAMKRSSKIDNIQAEVWNSDLKSSLNQSIRERYDELQIIEFAVSEVNASTALLPPDAPSGG